MGARFRSRNSDNLVAVQIVGEVRRAPRGYATGTSEEQPRETTNLRTTDSADMVPMPSFDVSTERHRPTTSDDSCANAARRKPIAKASAFF
jgi:hypothetical protein